MPKQTPIVIFGAGGFAREVLQIILDINDESANSPPWEPLGFIVEEGYPNTPNTVHGLPVQLGYDWLALHPEVHVVIAVGSSAGRSKIAARVSACGNVFATLVHPKAWLGRQVAIGPGSVVCAGSLITTDIDIGEHVHVNIGCTVGHDAKLGNFVTVNPRVSISGNVVLGNGCEIGTGSVLIPHSNVGAWSIIGAGAIVTKPLSPNVTAVGAPARIIKTREPGWHES
jgi:sugar O-acyltransferase (sialic acid O-acetyltransferase NeuD family)